MDFKIDFDVKIFINGVFNHKFIIADKESNFLEAFDLQIRVISKNKKRANVKPSSLSVRL